jgi:hypothetical protein
MARIKTTIFSLKAYLARLQRLLVSYRIAGRGFLLAAVSLNCLLTPGCKEEVGPGITSRENFELKEIELENVRFEPLGLPFSIQPARAYWLRRGDVIAPRWDTHELHWARRDAMPMCEFSGDTSAGDCQVCNYCDPPASLDGLPCLGVTLNDLGDLPRVVAYPGFMETANPLLIDNFTPDAILSACSGNPQSPMLSFAPMISGLYILYSPLNYTQDGRVKIRNGRVKFNGATNGEIKLHVVEEGEPLAQQIAYKLKHEVIDGRNYWTFTIDGDPLWKENFSPNLRVTYVRIYKGVCADGSAQGKECIIPNESPLARPSRIIFLPNFYSYGTVGGYPYPGEAQHRCYSNPNASDGNSIKLDICRERHDLPLNQTVQKLATPAYEPAPAGQLQKLTWLVEFNTNEGADANLMTPGVIEPMPPGAELIIEFTIQAND